MTIPAQPTVEPSPVIPAETPHRRLLITVLYIGLGLGLLYAGTVVVGGVSDAIDQIRHLDAWWLAPGLGAVGLRFVLLGVQLRRLRGEGQVPNTRLAVGVAFLAFGLGAQLPAAPAEGFVLSTNELHRRGMASRSAWLMLAASQWLQFWTLIAVFGADRIIVASSGELRHRDPVGIGISSVVLFASCAAAFWVVRRPGFVRRLTAVSRLLPKQRHKTHAELEADGGVLHEAIEDALGNRRNRFAAITLTGASLVADAFVFWCMLIAVRADVSFEVAVLAYVAATAVAWVPFIPNGYGLTEVAIPALLHHFGVPYATGLAAVLLWRVVAQGVPAVCGFGVWITVNRAARSTPVAPSCAPGAR